jgi:hypothetical protein
VLPLAFPLVRGLLLWAKHLFVAAMPFPPTRCSVREPRHAHTRQRAPSALAAAARSQPPMSITRHTLSLTFMVAPSEHFALKVRAVSARQVIGELVQSLAARTTHDFVGYNGASPPCYQLDLF